MSTTALADSQLNLNLSFTVAAWVVILGVLGSWIYLEQGIGQGAVDLPDIPTFTLTTVQDVNEISWVEQAEQAYAAGRVTRPEGDSALYFYQKILERDAENAVALEGMQRVISYLISGAEGALQREDWLAAMDFAQQTLAIDSRNLSAKSISTRVQRYERIKKLNDLAVNQIAAGNLTRPEGDNALESFREILRIDPSNTVAQQGIESVAQRLATIAQTEAFAENHERARELIALAKTIAPDAPGIAQTEKLTLQWTDMVKDQAVKQELLSAARALQAGDLVSASSPTGVGALDHYRTVLKRDPDSAAAQSGIQLVIGGLVERAWTFARNEDVEGADKVIVNAREAGATDAQLVDLLDEIDFLRRRETARTGEFDDVLPIRELTARRQGAPILPRNAGGGWVELLFTVTEEGSVADIVVVQTDNDELREPAIKAIEKWRFEPHLDEGRPMPVRSGVRFSFQT